MNSPISSPHLFRKAEQTERYTAMLAAVRAWLQYDHPEAEYAVVIAEIGDGLPSLQVPIIQPDVIAS